MRSAALTLAVVLAAAAAPAAAQEGHDHGGQGEPNRILLRAAAVTPAVLTVLEGDTVSWRNASFKRHTVTSRDGLFDASLGAGGGLAHTFTRGGDYGYFCRIHPTITGSVRVRRVILHGPAAPVVRGEAVELHGRALPGAPAAVVERDGAAVAEVPVAPDGTFTARVPGTTGAYRAVVGPDASEPLPVSVVPQRLLTVRRKATRLRVTVSPPAPGAAVVLQLHLRERFGWWPVRRARLDARSRASFIVPRRRGLGRVALTRPDGATVVAISRTFSQTAG